MARKKVKFDFNPFAIAGVNPSKGSRAQREELLEEVADYVQDQIRQTVEKARSPVKGIGKFKALTKDYRAIKRSQGGSGIADLELTSEMLNSLSVEILKGNVIRATFSNDQQPKADGHHNVSGRSKLPRRPAIPDADRDETWNKQITAGIRRIVEDFGTDG